MNRNLVLTALVSLLAATGVAVAQPGMPDGAKANRHAQHFARADANGDGMLTREETGAASPILHVLFDAVDANHDGVLVVTEAQAFRQRMAQAKRAEGELRARAYFARLDTDRSGFLTPAEITQTAPRLARRFDFLDTNRDGRLSPAEVRVAGKHGGDGGHGGHGR